MSRFGLGLIKIQFGIQGLGNPQQKVNGSHPDSSFQEFSKISPLIIPGRPSQVLHDIDADEGAGTPQASKTMHREHPVIVVLRNVQEPKVLGV